MLYVKGDYYLGEFISALKHAIELALPIENQDAFMSCDEDPNSQQKKEIDYSANLFEHYRGFDLSFLKGYAVIIPT